jgi:dTDP-4-amino-4,6-dideoxygalactose transaminase
MDECLKNGRLTLGSFGQTFEEEFAVLCNVRYAVAVNSGTSALEIILRSIGVAGRDVIVPTNTFYATAGAVLHAGGRVRFVDCEPESFALDVESLRDALSPATAAVIVVHIGGIITPQIAEIRALCDAVGVPLIEDAAHAHGCRLGGKPAGSFGLAAAFSFYPTKVMTSAEGGMIVTDDEALYQEALIYRDQGKQGFATNYHVRLGYNWRMSEPHAIIGLAQLRRLDEFIERRAAVAAVYDAKLSALGPTIEAVRPAPGSRSSYYKYIALLRGADRVELKRLLREDFDIGLSGEVYDTPCHLQPVFQGMCDYALPKAEDFCAHHICLPVSARMTEDDARYVVDALETALARKPAAALGGD